VPRAGPCSRAASMATASFLEVTRAFPRLAAEGGREGRIPCSASWPAELSRQAGSNRRHRALQGWAREGNNCWEGIPLRFQLALTRYLKPPFAHPELGKLLEAVLVC
jgi:hypothetical protein